MNQDNEIVTSIFGKITRREMFQRLAVSGLAIGLTGGELTRAFAANQTDGVTPPPREIGGTPFRALKQYQTYLDDKFDIRLLQRSGVPKPRTRDTSWFDKPSNAVGVSLLQFTNVSDNSCAQAACATILNFYKKAPDGLSGDAITNKISTDHPPDGGERGTSFRFTVATLEAYGMKTWTGRSNELGEGTMYEKLKTYVSQGRPAIVFLDLRKPQRLNVSGTLGHFVVVYAYTDKDVFLTNWNYSKRSGWLNDWETFKVAWGTPDCQNHHLMAVAWA